VTHDPGRVCPRQPSLLLTAAIGVVVSLVVASCASTPSREPPPQVPGGDPRRGAAAIERNGCGSCHVIPGIRGAAGTVGPPLTDFADRGYIAGELPNNGDNLIRWIIDPRVVEPGTDMPSLDIGEAEARDIAAYLFTLGR
jgi:cytochrome c